MANSQNNIDWFRHTAPYIKAHRGKTFVVYLGNGVMSHPDFTTLIHDLALLHSLGVKLVLVHATREAINDSLSAEGEKEVFHQGTRVTDDKTLSIAVRSAAHQRIRLEQMISMGLPNTPLRGARIRVMSGNFITARPIGIHDGQDFLHTGSVRRIDVTGVLDIINKDSVALISPLGYSPAGELFSLSATEVAERLAVSIGADKLIFLDRSLGLTAPDGALIRQCTLETAQQLLIKDPELSRLRDAACRACAKSVERSHIVSFKRKGSMIEELFTHDGAGTLISQNTYEQARRAQIEDISGIVQLIRPLEDSGALIKRSRERLKEEIKHFFILERDGRIIACAALYPLNNQIGEIACVATHIHYRGAGRAQQLLKQLLEEAKAVSLQRVFALTTQSAHWFLEQGFEISSHDELPAAKKQFYNWSRNALVLMRIVEP